MLQRSLLKSRKEVEGMVRVTSEIHLGKQGRLMRRRAEGMYQRNVSLFFIGTDFFLTLHKCEDI